MDLATGLVFYPFFNVEGQIYLVQFECPGCGYGHPIYVMDTPGRPHPTWTWNGSLAKPTLSPSVLVSLPEGGVCHSFVKEGQIEFLSDCTHHLAGRTLPLVGYPPTEFDGCPLTVSQLLNEHK